jgi:hypothetical protein
MDSAVFSHLTMGPILITYLATLQAQGSKNGTLERTQTFNIRFRRAAPYSIRPREYYMVPPASFELALTE